MRDLTICYTCKLSEPHVNIRKIKGKPTGECISCRNAREQRKRNKARLYKDFYDRGRKLADWNYNQLASLSLGSYSLVLRQTKAVIGHITIGSGVHFIQAWGDRYLLKQDLYGVSTWLSNLGVLIDSPAPEVIDNDSDLQPQSVAALLYMFDQALQDYAYNRLKDELAASKTKTKAFNKPPMK